MVVTIVFKLYKRVSVFRYFYNLQIIVSQHSLTELSLETFATILNISFKNLRPDSKFGSFPFRLFVVEEWKQNPQYQPYISSDILGDIDIFKEQGVFNRNVVDLVINACCNLLRIPIVTILSDKQLSLKICLPAFEQLCNKPLFIAFNTARCHCNATCDESSIKDKEMSSAFYKGFLFYIYLFYYFVLFVTFSSEFT